MDRLLLKWVLEVPDLQVRAPRDGAAVQADVVRRYADLLLDGVEFPPVLVMRVAAGLPQVMVLDGRHRLAAHRLAGREDIAVEYSEAKDIRAGLEVALKANGAHGLPRSREDLRHCIGLADKLWPEVSDREIARRLGCGHSWVSEVRRKAAPVLAVECPVPDTEAPTSKLHEGFEGQVVIGVDYGADPPARVVMVSQELAPAPETGWVEDVDRELAGMGPGRVLLASGEAEVPVVQDDADPGRRFYSGGTVTLTLNDPVLSEKLFAAVAGPKRHRGQDPLERWYTDPALATVCWRWLLESGLLKDVMPTCAGAQLRCLEPCVGGGAWLAGLEAASRSLGGDPSQASWVVMDADPEAPGLRLWKDRVAESVVGDFLTTPWDGWKFDLIISNPPNSLARDIIEESIRRLDWHGVAAFLLPASWMAAKRRRGWLSLNPPRVVALVPWRPSFEGPAAELQGTGEGSPTQDYALHVWVNGDPPGRTWTGTWIEDTSEVEDGEE